MKQLFHSSASHSKEPVKTLNSDYHLTVAKSADQSLQSYLTEIWKALHLFTIAVRMAFSSSKKKSCSSRSLKTEASIIKSHTQAHSVMFTLWVTKTMIFVSDFTYLKFFFLIPSDYVIPQIQCCILVTPHTMKNYFHFPTLKKKSCSETKCSICSSIFVLFLKWVVTDMPVLLGS